jgi:hypothetical protein
MSFLHAQEVIERCPQIVLLDPGKSLNRMRDIALDL